MRRSHRKVFIAPLLFALVGLASSCASAATVSSTHSTSKATGPLVSPAVCAKNRAAGTMTFVSPFGYDASAGIIDIFAAKALGYFSDLCIGVSVDIPSFTTSPYALVSTGVGTVTSEGSAADYLVEVSNGANLDAVATFGDTSDYALLTSKPITSLRKLDGKTLGYHTVLPVVLSEMLKNAGVNTSKVKEVNDTTYDPLLLIHGTFQGLQAYQTNEPLTLEAAGYQRGVAFHEWTPAQFGVKGTFNVDLVNGTFLKRHASTVADFLRAELKAVSYCTEHVDACVAIEQRAATAGGDGPGFVVSHEAAEWRLEASLVTHDHLAGKGIGVQTIAEWRPEANAVFTYGLVKHAPDLAAVENTKLAASLYRGTTLIWP